MTLRYSRGEGFGWMRLASRTSQSYRLVTVFSLIWFLLSLVTPLAKKLNMFSAYIAYILMYYTPTRFLLHPISPNSIQITLARSNARGIHLVSIDASCHPKETVEPELAILKPAIHATLLHSYHPRCGHYFRHVIGFKIVERCPLSCLRHSQTSTLRNQ
jgi:hypothetical protein